MSCSATPPSPVYRVARRGGVWSWPDWASAGPDRTFGNRFDDCEGLYRVLYAASRSYGCYLETLARFRPSLEFYAELAAIGGDVDHAPPGVIDADWRARRCLGVAITNGRHADVGSGKWIRTVRHYLAEQVIAAGFTDFDAHALFSSAPRTLTQEISRLVFDNRCDGIRYVSKFALEAECWAFFEGRVSITEDSENDIRADDPDLAAAMETHHLAF